MRSYEGVFIYAPESGPDAREKELKTLEENIKKQQGSITEKLDWGKKTLGYPIKKFREGYFVVLKFQMDTSKIEELRRILTLDEQLLKFMLTVEGPKAAPKEAKQAAVPPAKPASQTTVPAQ